MTAAFPEQSTRIADYLRTGLLPLWAERGWDRERGGCHEQLEPDRSPSPLGYRRLTVAGRQLYVFSEAARLGYAGAHAAHAHRIYEHLAKHFWDRDHGGWYFKIDLAGAPFDRTKDLYGQAFAMFGLAHYYASFGRREALELARETNRLVKRHLALPAGWFAAAAAEDWTVTERELEQNPHMHLLEAYVALDKATGEIGFQEDAAAVVELFHRQLYDAVSGVLGEFFDAAGRPEAARGHLVEPGHHFEWCWLLQEGATLWREAASAEAARALFEWAERYGVDRERGGVYDALDRAGAVVRDSKRLWPQTERIKAHAMRLRREPRAGGAAALAAQVEFLFEHYLAADGGWHERLDRTLAPIAAVLPATSCYHIFIGLTEALKALGR